MNKTERMQALVDFVNEPFDESRSYELFCRGCSVAFEMPTSAGEYIGIDGNGIDLGKIPVLIVEDRSLHLSLEDARITINHILRTGGDVSYLKLSDVSTIVVMVGDRPVVGLILGGYPFTEGDLLFTFFENIKRGDIGSCMKEGCGKLFLGTRKGTKKFCSPSCRVAYCQKEKRRKKIEQGGKNNVSDR